MSCTTVILCERYAQRHGIVPASARLRATELRRLQENAYRLINHNQMLQRHDHLGRKKPFFRSERGLRTLGGFGGGKFRS